MAFAVERLLRRRAALVALALASARAVRLGTEPLDLAPDWVFDPNVDLSVFDDDDALQLDPLPNGTFDFLAQASPAASGKPLEEEDVSDEALAQKVAALGYRPLRAMAKLYIPELVFDKPPSSMELSHHVVGVLQSDLPPEASRQMSDLHHLHGDQLAEALCSCLGARLLEMPWLQTLRRVPGLRMRRLFAALVGYLPGAPKRGRMMAAIVRKAREDSAARDHLVHELSDLQDGVPAAYLTRCPELVRSELGSIGASPQAREPEQEPAREASPAPARAKASRGPELSESAKLAAQLRDAFDALGYQAVKAMAEKYTPELAYTPAAHSAFARRLSGMLLRIAPVEAVRQMSRFTGADLIGELCHWLGVRLRGMPWAPPLERLSLRELYSTFAAVGLRKPKSTSRRRLVANMLRAVSDDNGVKERLVRELQVPASASDAPVGYLDECPEVVRLEFAAHAAGIGAQTHTIDEDDVRTVYVRLGERFEFVFAPLGPDALRSMTAKYTPELAGMRGGQSRFASRLARLLPGVVPLAEAKEMWRLGHAELVGAFCHWFGVRLRQGPLLDALEQMSTAQLHILAARLGAAVRGPGKRHVVLQIVTSASQDPSSKEVLAREVAGVGVGRLVDTSEVGYLAECPESVRRAVAHASNEVPWARAP